MTSNKFLMPDPADINNKYYGNFDIAHQYIPTPQWNFGVNAKARVLNDIFNDSSASSIVWQPDTYHSAKKYTNNSAVKRIIDLGCGSALKLKYLFQDCDIDVFAVDFAVSLVGAKQNYPEATHIECDLTSWNEILAVAKMFRDDVPTVILCADVIEHMSDPRPLLALIRLILAGSTESRCFLSTPDRSRLGYKSLTSTPANPAHIREWTNGELRDLLMASGFHIAQIGNIRANVHDKQASTLLVECSFNSGSYVKVLERYGITTKNVSSVMITTEYPGLVASGGIGTFVADWHRSNGSSAVLAAFDFEKANKLAGDIIFSPSDIIDISRIDDVGAGDILLQTITQLLFICPNLKEIHFQEYLGIGARIAQAKNAGILPDTITIVVHCHGNQHYLENANGYWSAGDAQTCAVKEKICIELSDLVIFPSIFLRDLYIQAGIRIESDKVLICPYRYTNILADSLEFSKIERIVFIGKFLPMKGFDLICESFNERFCKELKAKGIKEVVFIGRGPENGFVNETIIRRHFRLTVHNEFDHAKLVSYIKENRSNALFVEPYRGDNFPLAVYDVVGNGGLLLAGNAGGIPEMFQVTTWTECLTDLSVEHLCHKIRELIDWDNDKKSRIITELISDLRSTNIKANSIRYEKIDTKDIKLLSSTVMIPFYNTDISEFTELLKSLNQQSLKPTEIIIVNDASDYMSRIEMAEAAQKHLNIRFRIIDHAYNCGLAYARNTALAACTTELILNADSDDVPLNDWIKTIVVALSRDPSAAAAVPYLTAFDAGTNFNQYHTMGQYTYRPLGDGFVTSQVQNELGHANAGFRVSHARSMGGWNSASKAKYEDWAFYLNIIANGLNIVIIPTVTCLYRIRKNSMARTYSEWPGQVRLYQTTNGLSRFESLQLQRLSRLNSDPRETLELKKRIRALENRKVIKMINSISSRLEKIPFIYATIRKVLFFTRIFANRIRSIL